MRIYDEAAKIAAAPSDPSLPGGVRQLLAQRVSEWAKAGLLDLTYLIIAESGDTEQQIMHEAGFSLLPRSEQESGFDYVGCRSDGVIELFACVSNDGFAFWVILSPGLAEESLYATALRLGGEN